MAEPDYVTYDKYRADLADFRADMARFREEVRTELANMRRDLTAEISAVRHDLTAEINGVKGEISSLKLDGANIRVEMARLHGDTIKWLAGIVATGVALTVTLIKVIP